MGKLSRRLRSPNFFPCFFLLTRDEPSLSLVMQQGREAWGSCPDVQGLQTFFLLLPSHERISLVEYGHAAEREGVGKLSRCQGTPNFVPSFFFLTSDNPCLSLVTEQGGEAWGSCPDVQGLETIFLLFPSHERISLVEFGHAVGKGRVGKLSRRPGFPNYFPASSLSRENIPG